MKRRRNNFKICTLGLHLSLPAEIIVSTVSRLLYTLIYLLFWARAEAEADL